MSTTTDSTNASSEAQEHNGNFSEVEWKFPFKLGFSLGDLFQAWVFGGAKRQKTPPKTSVSTPCTPLKVAFENKRASMIELPSEEHIELSMFGANAQDDSVLWQRSVAPGRHVYLTQLPILAEFTRRITSRYNADMHIPNCAINGDCSVDDVDSKGTPKEFAFECDGHSVVPVIVWEEVPEGHTGAGHNFQPREMDHPTWCDRCGDLVWGLDTSHYLRCRNCNFTCHKTCREAVTLDCESLDQRSPSDAASCCSASSDLVHCQQVSTPGSTASSLPGDTPVEVEEVIFTPGDVQELLLSSPSLEDPDSSSSSTNSSSNNGVITSLPDSAGDLATRINYYNSHAAHGLEMTLEKDSTTFRGFIRVHLNLTRPINVVAGTRPPSIYDILKEDDTLEKKTLTTFYLPRDTVRALHVTSETTTQEVIRALLKKFKVVDNPRKFALYERYYDHGETTKVMMRRIADNEKPLVLALLWGCDANCTKRFVLQENETGDILWEAFTLPELNNFLKILDREEEEYKRQVRQKYKLMGMKIQEAMERLRPTEDFETNATDTTDLPETAVDDVSEDGTLKTALNGTV